MNQIKITAQDDDTSNRYSDIRFLELAGQSWDRNKSAILALSEGINLNDEHWAVILYLRKHYLEHGLPSNARTLDQTLNQQFSVLGGSTYLHLLFPGGPVAQGCRLANLSIPANATDLAFGSSD